MDDEQLQQFMALTNVSFNVAAQYLRDHNNDLSAALDEFYVQKNKSNHQQTSRTSSTSPLPSRGVKEKSMFQSFSEMVKKSSEYNDEQRNTFAGGETSGLEVTDPNNPSSLIRNILDKARNNGEQSNSKSDDTEKTNFFTGRGYRLGSSIDKPLQVVENVNQEHVIKPTKVTREITFWKEGFQIGDGPLYRYDDPTNSYYLNELNHGRAPLKLLDVDLGQEVDVNVHKRLNEAFVLPKKTLCGFHGKGQRLGSPIPGELVSQDNVAKVESKVSNSQVNKNIQGNTSVQIRYATGEREILSCNTDDTVRFLYDYVKSKTDSSRLFTLNHAFPVAPIDQFDSTIKDQGLCNSVVVQVWI